jgi:hypothetical protein
MGVRREYRIKMMNGRKKYRVRESMYIEELDPTKKNTVQQKCIDI